MHKVKTGAMSIADGEEFESNQYHSFCYLNFVHKTMCMMFL